ncbi:ABC transporter permease [Patescibacteria group bacterium]
MIKKYIRIWLKTTTLSLETNLTTKGASLMYIAGKFIRFGFFLLLLFVVMGKTKKIAGFNIEQMIIFFLVFNLLDIFGQVFFRGIYWFRQKIITGKFDLVLVKPINSLFQVMTTRTDFLDLPLLVIVIWLLIKYSTGVSLINLFLFLLLLFSGFLIVASIHIFIASVGVITTEVDNLMWIYRDISLLARVPVDIYINPVRVILTFVFPIALIFTFPSKALLGILSWQGVILSIFMSLVLVFISIKFWNFALRRYSSASS